ncbi:MAG TPA: hypothetical protein VFX15_14160 [Actinomycetes bacterium]|nr:hypothetical protein [Actinomycetes bacterium]
MGRVSPIPQQGAVFYDPRDEGRFLRVSYHPEQQLFVLSWWRDSTCLGTFQLDPVEAPRLIHAIASGLAPAEFSPGSSATSSSTA